MWGVGFRFHVFTLLGGKKHLSKPKKQLLQQKRHVPRALKISPSYALRQAPQTRTGGVKGRGLEPG